jgi:hypothetical protein
MMRSATRKLLAIATFASIVIVAQSQPHSPDTIESGTTAKTEARPFKVLTSGRQFTVKSSKGINSIMVWAASGHRIIEQKNINAFSYVFNITVNEKVFFVMVQLQDGKLYTEKVGVR